MTIEHEIEEAGEVARKTMIEQANKAGMTPARMGEMLAQLCMGEVKVGNGQTQKVSVRDRADALNQLVALHAAIPKRATRVNVNSEQRILSLSLGDGAVPGRISLDKLRAMPAARRREVLAALREVTADDETDATPALPAGESNGNGLAEG